MGSVSGIVFATAALAGPVGGNVVSGSADIAGQGSTAVTINQNSDRVVIDWANFDTQGHERVDFYQPGANSIALNRISNGSPTHFDGALTANGRVIIMNGNGVVFGANSRIDVNGLVATTANISNEDFMNGGDKLKFSQPGNPNAVIINNGHITAKEAGLVGFVAPNVINNGTINAKLGKIQLASGDQFTYDLYGDGLVEIAASDAVNKQLVENNGTLRADGGMIAMTASQAKNAVDSVISNSNVIEAKTVSQKNGVIILGGSKKLVQAGKLDVSGKASGGKGGTVKITADDVVLTAGSMIDASGDTGGGTVLVGGDYKGTGDMVRAKTTTMEAGATILNNAITDGDGGKTILWSDDTTKFLGSIEGHGGAFGGKGGFVETSGKENLLVRGNVDLRAADGSAGNWLLDPTDIYIYARGTGGTDNINSVTTDYLESQSISSNIILTADNNIILNMGGDVLTLANNRNITLTGTNGYITTASTSSIVTSGTGSIVFIAGTDMGFDYNLNLEVAGSGTITLQANNTIAFNAESHLKTHGGNILANANHTLNNTGGVYFNTGSSVLSNGGNITIGGGLDGLGVAENSLIFSGVSFSGTTIDATGTSNGGNIWINGKSGAGDNSSGVIVAASIIKTNYSGTINITGASGGTGSNFLGIGIGMVQGSVISSVNGNITMTGTGGQGAGGSNIGIGLAYVPSDDIIQSAGGNIILNGYGGAGANSYGFGLANPGASAGIFSTSGDITITGTNSGSSEGIANLASVYGSPATYGQIGNSSTSGTITYITDSFAYGFNTTTTGSVVIKPYTASQAINVGATSGGLYLSPTLLSQITAGNIIIGSNAQNGHINLSGNITWNAPVTFLANNGNISFGGTHSSAYNLTAQTLGTGNIITNGAGSLTLSGTGNLLLSSAHNISFNNSYNFATNTGSITFRANNNLSSSAGGNISTQGGSIVFNADRDANGLGSIYWFNASLTSQGGNIILGGGLNPVTDYAVGADVGSETGVKLYYVTLDASGTSSGGNVILNGKGWANSTNNGDHNGAANGIYLNVTTAKTNFNGIVTLNGEGSGTTGSGYNNGVYLASTAFVTVVNGTLTINAVSGFGNGGHGIVVNGRIESLGSGDINITAKGNAALANNFAIRFLSSLRGIFSASGNVTLVATEGAINQNSGGGTIGGSAATGTITLVTDLTQLDYTNLYVTTTGSVVIKPYTNTQVINVATGATGLVLPSNLLGSITAGNITIGSNSQDGAINVNAQSWNTPVTFLSNNGHITFSGTQTLGTRTLTAQTFGTGDIILGANITSTATSGTPITLTSGRDIKSSANGTLTVAGSSEIILFAGNDINFTNNISFIAGSGAVTLRANRSVIFADNTGNITTSGGAITLNSDRDGIAGGYINLGLYSNLTSNGGNIVLGGGVDPTTGYATGTAITNKIGVNLRYNGIRAGGGNIIINGKGASFDSSLGVGASGSSIETTGNGTITISGHSNGGTGNYSARGVEFYSTRVETQHGNISITGEVLSTQSNATAIAYYSTGFIRTNGTGNVFITAINPGNSQSFNTNAVITSGGNITYVGDKFEGSPVWNAAGNIILKPYTSTRDINVGNGTTAMAISAAAITNMTAGMGVVIGSNAQNGNINIGANTWSSNVSFLSNNGNINILGAQAMGARSFAAQTFGTGNIAFNNGSITSSLTGSAITLTSNGTITATGTNSLNATAGTVSATSVGNMTLSPVNAKNVVATVTGAGGKITTGAITTGTGGNITLTADDMDLTDNLSGTGTITLQANALNRAINIARNADDGSGLYLTAAEVGRLSAGWSQVYIGRSNNSGGIAIGNSTWNSKTNFRNTGTISYSASAFVANADIVFDSTDTQVYSAMTSNGYALTFNGRLIHYYGHTLQTNGGSFTVTGNYSALYTGSSATSSILTNGGNITLNGNIGRISTASAAEKTLILDAGAGNILIGGVIATDADVVINGNTITGSTAWGGSVALGNVTLTSVGNIVLPSITAAAGKTVSVTASGAGSRITTGGIATGTAGNITLTSDDVTIGGALSGTGTITLQPYATTRNVMVNRGVSGGSNWHMDSAEIANLSDGWGQINLGRTDATTAYMYFGSSTWTDALSLRSFAILLYDTLTTNSAFSTTATATEGHGATITTSGQNVTINGPVASYGGLTVTTNGGSFNVTNQLLTAGGDVNVATNGGNISITSSIREGGGTAGISAGKTISLNAGAGNVTIGGPISGPYHFTANGNTLTLSGGAIGTVGVPMGTVTLTSVANLTLPTIYAAQVNATVTGAGNKITTGAITTGTGGNITLTSDDVEINGALSGTGTITLQPYAVSRYLSINSVIANQWNLSSAEADYLTDGWSQINIGRTDSAAQANIYAITFKDPVVFRSLGNVYFNGAFAATGNGSVSVTNANAYLRGGSITTAGQNVVFGKGLRFETTGTITTNGGAVSVADFAEMYSYTVNSFPVTINTSGGAITLTGGLGRFGPNSVAGRLLTLNAGSGTVTFGNTVNGEYDLTVNAGSVVFNGAWGATTSLGSVGLTSVANLALPNITAKNVGVTVTGAGNKITAGSIAVGTGGNIRLESDDLELSGALSGTGTLTLQPYAISRLVHVNYLTADGTNWNLSTPELALLTNGWSQVNIGRTDGNQIMYIGASVWRDPVNFRNSNTVSVSGGLIDGVDNASFVFAPDRSFYFNGVNSDIRTAGGSITLGYVHSNKSPTINTTIASNGGNISIRNILFSTGRGVTINSGGGNVTIENIGSAVTGNKNVTISADGGSVAFTGPVTSGLAGFILDMSVSAQAISMNGSWGNASVPLGTITLNAVNSITLPTIVAGDTNVTVTGAGNKITTGAITAGIAGNITLTADDIEINGNLSGTGTLTLQPNDAARLTYVGNGTADGTNWNLSTAEIARLSNGWSQILLGRAISTATMNLGTTSWTDPVTFRGSNRIVVNGNITGTGDASFVFGSNASSWVNLFYGVTTAGQNVSFTGYTINAYGSSFVTTNGGNVSMAGTIKNGQLGASSFTVNAGSGTITQSGTIDSIAGHALDIAYTGSTITLSGALGNSFALGNVSLTAVNNIVLPSITTIAGKTVDVTLSGASSKITTDAINVGTGGNITLTSNSLTIGGNLSGTGVLTLQPYTASRAAHVANSTESGSLWHLSTAEIALLTDGWSQINLGRTDGAGLTVGLSTWTDPVVFRTGAASDINMRDNIVGTDNASLTFMGRAYAHSGNISLSTADQNITLFKAHTNTSLNVNAGNGNVYFGDDITGGRQLNVRGNNITLAGNIIGATSGSSLINLVAQNTLTLNDVTAYRLTAVANGANSDLVLNGNISMAGSVDAVLMTAGRDIYTTKDGSIQNSGTGYIMMTAGRDIRFAHDYDLLTTSGTVTLRANNDILYTGGGDITNIGGIVNISSDYDNDGAGATYLTTGSVFSTNGNISFTGKIQQASGVTVPQDIVINSGNGVLTFSGAVDGNYNIAATANRIVTNAAWGAATALNNVSLIASGVGVTLSSVNAQNIFAQTTSATGDITLSAGARLTALGTGDALVLASGRNFINLSDADVLNTPAGRWLVYSKNLANNTRGGLMANEAAQFGKTYASDAPSTIAAGNRFIFSDAANTAPVLIIKADDQIGTYGAINGTLTYTVSGYLANGDSASNIFTVAPVVQSSVNSTTNAGTYNNALTISSGTGLTNLGYQFVYQTGNFQVNKANLIITAKDQTKSLGKAFVFAGSQYYVSGLVNGNTVNHVDLSSAAADIATVPSETPYAIIASNATGTGLSNYNVTYVNGNFMIRSDTGERPEMPNYKQIFSPTSDTTTKITTALENTDQLINVVTDQPILKQAKVSYGCLYSFMGFKDMSPVTIGKCK